MRFFVLSDLHLKKTVQKYKTSDRLKRLCSKIRKSTCMGENVLFIILGDIADRGNELSFSTASENLNLIYAELKDYHVSFEFVPGNHDLHDGTLTLFDKLISKYGSSVLYEDTTAYSSIHDDVNFIFADSTLSRDYAAPGKLDLEEIRANIKPGLTNILFCHHAISHGHGDPHDVIEDGATVVAQLNSIGISFLFHGHVHDAEITIPDQGLIEVGCGSLSGGIEWLPSVFHQFLVGYLQEGRVVLIETWLDAEDGNGDFALRELYPKSKDFCDPDKIGQIAYDPVVSYIPRKVCSYEDCNQGAFLEVLSQGKSVSLQKAMQTRQKVLLLCEAGMGKSTELNNLAYELCSTFHTFLYSLEDYNGEEIDDLLPNTYRQLPPNRIALLLDGYDELDTRLAKIFRNKLKKYTRDATGVHIVIASRSNFCGNESKNESKNFSGFFVYVLQKIYIEQIREYLESKGIDVTRFWNCTYTRGVNELIYNPFYLLRLSKVYAAENDLPAKKILMDKLISDTFDADELKFADGLEDHYQELFIILERLAIAMQLMHQQFFDDREEYQAVLSSFERELVKKSGLLEREGGRWKFLHNNFREYLAARCLSRLPKNLVIPVFYDGTSIKPYWVNTLGYYAGFNLDWSLSDWLKENSPTALVKFESDRLEPGVRVNVFKRIFEKFEIMNLYFHDDLCDVAELARFVNSNEVLSFLLDRIHSPKNLMSQYNAINILRHYPSLFDKRNDVRETLLQCCEKYPITDKSVCRLAIMALCQLQLQTEETTGRLMSKFSDVDEDYIRLGMYEYILETKLWNTYVDYCLSGIKLVAYEPNKPDETRIGNEYSALMDCLKRMSSVESVTRLLRWFSQKNHPVFAYSDKVLESVVATAINLYYEEHTELLSLCLSLYYEATKVLNTSLSKGMVQFFVKTGTQYSAAIFALEQFTDNPYCTYELIRADNSIMESLKAAYEEGKIKDHCAFQKIVVWGIQNEIEYRKYAELIKKVDGFDLPEFKAPVNYEALEKKGKQEYFEILFDTEKRQELTMRLLQAVGNPEITTSQLFDSSIKMDFHSAIHYLQVAMYQYRMDVKVSEFFDKVNLEQFVLWTASRLLAEKSGVVVLNKEEKENLSEVVANILKTRNFKNSVQYTPTGSSVKVQTVNLLFMIQYLDYPLDEESLLDLTELPSYAFDDNDKQTKYKYLKRKLSPNELKSRLIQNVKNETVKASVLKDHIDFFDRCKDPSLAEYARKMCDGEYDSDLKSSAWKYLYDTLGAEYIADEVLPVADEKLLLEISSTCKDIPKGKLCGALEREYSQKPSIRLQAHLIAYGSSKAINDYVTRVTAEKHTPEGKNVHVGGPTEAISCISDPVFLPQLETLLIAVLDPDFKDCQWGGLQNSLTKALAHCGTVAYDETIQLIERHIPSANEEEEKYRYCNYTMQEVTRARNSIGDKAMSLTKTKEFLDQVKSVAGQSFKGPCIMEHGEVSKYLG